MLYSSATFFKCGIITQRYKKKNILRTFVGINRAGQRFNRQKEKFQLNHSGIHVIPDPKDQEHVAQIADTCWKIDSLKKTHFNLSL